MAKPESEGARRVRVCSPHLSGAVAQGSPSDLCCSWNSDSVAPGLSEVLLIPIPVGQDLETPSGAGKCASPKAPQFGDFLSGELALKWGEDHLQPRALRADVFCPQAAHGDFFFPLPLQIPARFMTSGMM